MRLTQQMHVWKVWHQIKDRQRFILILFLFILLFIFVFERNVSKITETKEIFKLISTSLNPTQKIWN